MKEKIKEAVILPGSYDPVTLGHLDIIKQAAQKYEEVYVVAFVNPAKKYTFSVDYADGRHADVEMSPTSSFTVDGREVESDFFGGQIKDIIRFCAGGLSNLYRDWFSGKLSYSLEEMTRLSGAMIRKIISNP